MPMKTTGTHSSPGRGTDRRLGNIAWSMKPKPTHAGVHRTEAIMKYRISRTFTLVAALTALCASQDAVAQQVDRTVLPIPEPQPPVVTELSARDVSPPARFDVKAPQGAPNVVV